MENRNETLQELGIQLEELLLMRPDSDDPEEIEAWNESMDTMIAHIDKKLDAYCHVYGRIDAQETYLKGQRDRIDRMIKTLEYHKDHMKEGVLNSLQLTGRTEVKTDLHRVSIAKNGGKQPLKVDPVHVPDSYMKITYSIDTDKIRAALDAGEDLPFAHYEERGVHLNIR